jgi:hypothetical protein
LAKGVGCFKKIFYRSVGSTQVLCTASHIQDMGRSEIPWQTVEKALEEVQEMV